VGNGCDGSDIPAVEAEWNVKDMNRALLIIAIPAFLVSLFWLTIGWGWRTALVGGCVELAVVIGAVVYITRRNNEPPNPRCGGVIE
jgi:hypothetical protein